MLTDDLKVCKRWKQQKSRITEKQNNRKTGKQKTAKQVKSINQSNVPEDEGVLFLELAPLLVELRDEGDILK